MQSFDIPVPGATGKRFLQPLRPRHVLLGVLLLLACSTLGAVGFHLFVPPSGFPTGHVIALPADATVREMATELERERAIRSAFLFRVYARLSFQDRSLASGLYVFDRPIGLAPLVARLARGDHGIEPARVTLTEGMTVKDMAATLQSTIPDLDTDAFLSLASTSEGYLFPDTYFFMPNVTPEEVMRRLGDRFKERIGTITPQLEASEQSLEDIIIMASILEREANTPEDMRIVAGILWKRMEHDMPLQVDAVFGYIHGKSGYAPTAADLELDSPYNTYLYRGLPPTPIANPGLEAIVAAADPAETPYFYYLTGRDGLMHYGRTFDEHKENRARYLD